MNEKLTQSAKFPSSIVLKSISVSLLVLVLFVSITTMGSPSAHASAVTPSPQCSVSLVHLNGSRPATTTCLQWQQSSGVHPNIYQLSCAADNAAFIMRYNNGNNVICFAGAGYTSSTGWFNVTSVSGFGCGAWGWVFAYKNNQYPGHRSYWNDNGIYSGNTVP